MTLEEHVAAAEQFLASSRLLQDAGDSMGSAEMVWGAAIQAVQALRHQVREEHPHRRRDLERIIFRNFPAPIVTRLAGGIDASVRLHNYFYTGTLSYRNADDTNLATRMAQSRAFVNETLQLAQGPA